MYLNVTLAIYMTFYKLAGFIVAPLVLPPKKCEWANAGKPAADYVAGNARGVAETYWPYIAAVIVAILLVVGWNRGVRTNMIRALAILVGCLILYGIFAQTNVLSGFTNYKTTGC